LEIEISTVESCGIPEATPWSG